MAVVLLTLNVVGIHASVPVVQSENTGTRFMILYQLFLDNELVDEYLYEVGCSVSLSQLTGENSEYVIAFQLRGLDELPMIDVFAIPRSAASTVDVENVKIDITSIEIDGGLWSNMLSSPAFVALPNYISGRACYYYTGTSGNISTPWGTFSMDFLIRSDITSGGGGDDGYDEQDECSAGGNHDLYAIYGNSLPGVACFCCGQEG